MKLRLISEGEHKDAFGTHKWKTYAQIPTNADRIRSMSDEELAHLLHSAEEHLFTGNLWNYDKWTEWLKQKAEDDNHDH